MVLPRDKTQWVRVTRGEPCKVCERGDWCTRSADGLLARCMRIQSEKECQKGGWIHKLEPGMVAQVFVKPEKPKAPVDWQRLARTFSSDVAALPRLSKSLGVSVEALAALWVGRSRDRAGEFTSWPQRDSAGNVVGIVRRYWDGAKKSMFGSALGLHYATFWADMPGPVFVVEGGSDTAALIDCGVNVIGRPSNRHGAENLTRMLRRTRHVVVVIGENDCEPQRRGKFPQCPVTCNGCANCWPGRYGAQEMMRKIRIQPARLHWCLPPAEFKDMRTWFNAQASRPTAIDFLSSAERWGR